MTSRLLEFPTHFGKFLMENSSDGSSVVVCSICLCEEVDNPLISLPCLHGFHLPCISRWYESTWPRTKCPNCRAVDTASVVYNSIRLSRFALSSATYEAVRLRADEGPILLRRRRLRRSRSLRRSRFPSRLIRRSARGRSRIIAERYRQRAISGNWPRN